jgi:hypothetical protein
MVVRLSGIAALSILLVPIAASAQSKGGEAQSRPSASAVTGVLKGADYTHDGKSEWAAFVATESATFSINGGGEGYKNLKKLVGKRVAVKGTVAKEMVGSDGRPMKLSGSVGGIRYEGAVSIGAAGDVTPQPVTELTGMVEVEEKAGADQKAVTRIWRIIVADDRPVTYVATATAAKKLKDLAGKRVVARCYLNGETIDDVERIALAKEVAEKPGR